MSSDVKRQPLPRGRHNLPAEVVRASQRERLVEAMLASVAERGYAATTVPQVVAEAKVSRNAFYALFTDKVDCFIAVCDDMAVEILALLADVSHPYWLNTLRESTGRYLKWWADRPQFSRAYFLELPFAGPRAVEQRERQYARFEDLLEAIAQWARMQQPELPPLSPLATRAIVATVTDLVAEETRVGRVEQLPRLRDEVVRLQARLLADEVTAAKV